MAFRSARTGVRLATAGILAVGLVLSGCAADRGRAAAEASGWHPVAPAPDQLPIQDGLWVAEEVAFFSAEGGPSFAYRPQSDTWRPVSPPPITEEPNGWTMVSTGSQVVAVTRTATVVYSPKSDSWRSLAPPPKGRDFFPPDVWRTSLVWTGREVAMAQPAGDDIVALDVLRGRWRSLPRTGFGTEGTEWLGATSSGLVFVASDNYQGPRRVYLLRPGADQWRSLPDLPVDPVRIVSAGDDLVVAGDRLGGDVYERGKYLLPEGRWEPLPASPVLRHGEVAVGDGGLVALWYGNAAERPERPNGALLRPGTSTWEVVPPPPQPMWRGTLVAAGKDFLLVGRRDGDFQPIARFRPPSSPGPAPRALPSPDGLGVCSASAITAARGPNGTHRGAQYEITLTNRSQDFCTLAGPVEITATTAEGSPVAFPGGRSATAGSTVVVLPEFEWGAKLLVRMHTADMSVPPRGRPECADAPIAHHLFVSWPGADGTVEIVPSQREGRGRYLLCNVEVFSFVDPWPTL